MENFIVSARKYRPATFDTVVGQSSITSTLKNAIANNHLAQAYLFTGPRGVGKTTTARIFAKTINCLNIDLENNPENIEPCNQCESCQSFSNNSSFNIYELDAASNNSVDDIRQLVDQVRIPPQVGKYKIYIIDEVHMLSAQAFNAFLKTLEEPPAYVKFILATTERHKIIPTILSRCQVFNFSRITVGDMAKHLRYVAENENVIADDDSLHLIAEKADGALRDALSIFDQLVSFTSGNLTYKLAVDNLHVLDQAYFFKISDNILKGNISHVLLLLNDIIEKGFDGQHFIVGLGEHLRSLMISKDAATIDLMDTSQNIKDKYKEEAPKYSVSLLVKSLDLNNQCDLSYRASNNKRLLLELSLMQMCGLANAINNPEAEKKTLDLKKNEVSQSFLAELQVVTESLSNIPKPTIHTKQSVNTATTNNSPSENKINISEEKATYKAPVSQSIETTSPPTKRSTGRGFTSGMGLGFSLNQKEKTLKQEEDPQAYMFGKENVTDPVDPAKLKEIIDNFIINLHNQPSLKSVLLEEQPQMINESDIEFKLYNDSQAKDLSEHSEKLLMRLRTKLNNYSLRMKITIIKTAVYTAKGPKDKYDNMVKKNIHLQTLKEKLSLEIES
ncbi:MAG: DNA polymerase III subunit gamma/tau [Bacteroidetes bacterium 4572_77]|nr:MAG: DNA polymerase III subunit gamma/tau [Bacteroidetes bacterium 4572_77]